MKSTELAVQNSTAASLVDNRIVIASHQMKVSEFDAANFSELKNRLLAWSKHLGISNVPTADEMAELIMFIRRNYAHKLTLQDIALAFEYAVTGKTGASVKHNHEFNIGFVAPILNAYVDLKLRELDKVKRNETVKQIPMSQEQLDKILLDGAIKAFENYKKLSYCLDIGGITFMFLDRQLGVIPFSNEVRAKILADAKLLLEAEAKNKVNIEYSPSMKNSLERTLNDIQKSDSDVVKSKARQICLERFFKMLIEIDYTLEDYIKENTK